MKKSANPDAIYFWDEDYPLLVIRKKSPVSNKYVVGPESILYRQFRGIEGTKKECHKMALCAVLRVIADLASIARELDNGDQIE